MLPAVTGFFVTAFLVVAASVSWLPQMRAAPRESSCAAFAPDDAWATAVVNSRTITLELRRATARAVSAEMTLENEPLYCYCRIFFSGNAKYAAVAVYVDSGSGEQLRVGVLDRATGVWASKLDVEPKDTLQSKIRFEGFLQDTSTLVVTGIAKHRPLEDTPLTTVLYSADGKIEREFNRSLPSSNSSWNANAVDAKRNRLWFIGSPQFCPMRSVTLTGSIEYGPQILKTAEGCFPEVIAFPRDDTVVGASTGNDNWAWKVDFRSGKAERLKLPQAKPGPLLRWISYSMSHEADVSPDGDVMAIGRSATAWDLLDRPHDRDGELDIIRVEPFGLVKGMSIKQECSG